MTTTGKTKFWAVGLKNWVELRESASAPVANVTKAEKVIKERVPKIVKAMVAGQFKVEQKLVKKTVVIKAVTFEGGKVVATVEMNRFRSETGLSIKPEMVVEVPEDYAKGLIERDWSTRWLKV